MPRFAQAFITTCNLPTTLTGLLEWVGDAPQYAGTPVDNVLGYNGDEEFMWTAPARVGAGDVGFFHYAARATSRITKLRRQAQREGLLRDELGAFFDMAAEVELGRLGNPLTGDILEAVPGCEEFRDVTAKNWRGIVCREEQHFRHEADVRGYFASHLLEEVKDPGSAIHGEVRCVDGKARSSGAGRARADYLVQLDGR